MDRNHGFCFFGLFLGRLVLGFGVGFGFWDFCFLAFWVLAFWFFFPTQSFNALVGSSCFASFLFGATVSKKKKSCYNFSFCQMTCVFLFSFSGVGQKDTKKVTAPDVPIREFQKNDMFQFESFRKPTAPDVPTVFFSSV